MGLKITMLQRSIEVATMSSSSDKNSKPEPDRVYEPKQRTCLMCRDGFKSTWPGERVCQKCKSTNLWRAA